MVYKFPQLSRQEIEAMLELSELKQTRVYQEALQEGETIIVLRLLVCRFGQLYPEMRSQIQQLPIAQLEELGEALLDFSFAYHRTYVALGHCFATVILT